MSKTTEPLCPLLHSVRRVFDPATQTATLTLVGYMYGRDDRPVCGRVTVASDGEWVEAEAAVALVREHLTDGHSPVWLGRGWTVEYTLPLFRCTS